MMLLDSAHSYFSSVYKTLISIVCALSLGVLFSSENFNFLIDDNETIQRKLFVIFRMILMFMVICSVWYHYIMHNKYIFWSLKPRDVLVTFSWSATLVLPSVSILPFNGKEYYFIIFLNLNYLVGLWAYSNSTKNLVKYKKELTEKFEEQYGHYGRKDFSSCLYKTMYNFDAKIICFQKLCVALSFGSSMYISLCLPDESNLFSIAIYLINFILLCYFLIQNFNDYASKKLYCVVTH